MQDRNLTNSTNDWLKTQIPALSALVVFSIVGFYAYKYGGNSRIQSFKNWFSNLLSRLCSSSCSTTSRNEEDEMDRGAVIPTISFQVHDQQPSSPHSLYPILQISNYQKSSFCLDRSLIHYSSEYGKGWFGPVILGSTSNRSATYEPTYLYEPSNIPQPEENNRNSNEKIFIQQLREEACQDERRLFVQDGKASAIVGQIPAPERHPNVLAMVGCCLEKFPLILTYEFCSHGDLKTFLLKNRDQQDLFDRDHLTLRFCRDVTSGLAFLHRVKCISKDLAARTCQVDHFYNLKIGDYGLARSLYPGDYLPYQLETTYTSSGPNTSYQKRKELLPLRWMAPDLIKFFQLTSNGFQKGKLHEFNIEPSQSVWNLGITLWEICAMGATPFSSVPDEKILLALLKSNNFLAGSHEIGQLPGKILTNQRIDYLEEIFDAIELCLNWEPSKRSDINKLEMYFKDMHKRFA